MENQCHSGSVLDQLLSVPSSDLKVGASCSAVCFERIIGSVPY